MSVLERVHEALMTKGWMIASARALGLPTEAETIEALSPALAPDPRGPGKLHARDVVSYELAGQRHHVRECESIAHGDVDDFSRFYLVTQPGAVVDSIRGSLVARQALALVPPQLRRPSGRLSADYFRYSPGTASPPHQDKFGDIVVIWVLDRNGGGAESFLTGLDGRTVMRGPLGAGQLLVFRDEMFLHGVTPLRDGHRDALIFITLRQCCDMHNRNCEPPSELCCEFCTEARHGGWTDAKGNWRYGHPAGEVCASPDLSGAGAP